MTINKANQYSTNQYVQTNNSKGEPLPLAEVKQNIQNISNPILTQIQPVSPLKENRTLDKKSIRQIGDKENRVTTKPFEILNQPEIKESQKRNVNKITAGHSDEVTTESSSKRSKTTTITEERTRAFFPLPDEKTEISIFPPTEESPSELKSEDEQESLDGSIFEWHQDETMKPNRSFQTDDFLNWLKDDDFLPKKMNCLQGAAYYICKLTPNGKDFKKTVEREKAIVSTKSSNLKTQAQLFYSKLPEILGLTKKNSTECDLEMLISDFQDREIKPYSLISFGEPTGFVHVAIVSHNMYLRSLWKNPENENKSSFGKYKPQAVVDQVKQVFKQFGPEFNQKMGIEPNLCFISTKFCEHGDESSQEKRSEEDSD